MFSIPIEPFHMTSRRPYCCPKTTKRRPCWCSKSILWELNSFLMQTLSFVPINLRRCWSREQKRSTPDCFTCWHKQLFGSVWTASTQNWKDVSKIKGENEKWELSRELEMKWQLGPGFKLSFVPIFYFPVPHARYPLPVPILGTSQLEHHIIPEQFDALNHNLYFLKVFRVFIICLTKNTS